MSSGDTKPTEPLPEWAVAEPVPPRRRRVWPWIVALVVLVVLGVVVFFVAEAIARDVVERTAKTEIAERLALPADQEVDVEIPGLVIPQLLGGSLNEVTVSSDDVAVGEFEGDVTVTATDVPIQQGADIGGATATVTLDEAQLQSLLAQVDRFPSETVGLASPNVTITFELEVFGLSFPIGVALAPSVSDGALVLAPASFDLAGASIDAAAISERFGPIADVVLQDWTICLAEYLPAGVTLSDVEVSGDSIVVNADIDGAIVTDPALQANGTCG